MKSSPTVRHAVSQLLQSEARGLLALEQRQDHIEAASFQRATSAQSLLVAGPGTSTLASAPRGAPTENRGLDARRAIPAPSRNRQRAQPPPVVGIAQRHAELALDLRTISTRLLSS